MRPAEGLERLHELRHGRRCRLGLFSRSSSELLLEVVDEDGKTTCSASGQSNGRDGLVAVDQKLAGGKTRAATLSSSKFGETWQ
jgi:hypothetical protein